MTTFNSLKNELLHAATLWEGECTEKYNKNSNITPAHIWLNKDFVKLLIYNSLKVASMKLSVV